MNKARKRYSNEPLPEPFTQRTERPPAASNGPIYRPGRRLPEYQFELPRCPNCGGRKLTSAGRQDLGDDGDFKYHQCRACGFKFTGRYI
jgi:DNA-directed RNA polymerase subunit RPC12/RpoP